MHIMEMEGSLLCPQEPDTGANPEPHETSLHPPILLCKIHFNIILSSMTKPSKWSPFRFSYQNFVCLSLSSHVCYMLCPFHLHLLIFGMDYKYWGSSLSSFPQTPVTFSPVGRNIHLGTLFSSTMSLCMLFP
jgi:hypothetical protein